MSGAELTSVKGSTYLIISLFYTISNYKFSLFKLLKCKVSKTADNVDWKPPSVTIQVFSIISSGCTHYLKDKRMKRVSAILDLEIKNERRKENR